jgi:hypothetical protein
MVRGGSVLRAQGLYYLTSGLWAVVDRRSFEAVTGRKTDYWLVRTVGLLAAAIGAALVAGSRRERPSTETATLGLAAGAAFTAIDLVYVARGRIRPVYLSDAVVHTVLGILAAKGARSRATLG